MKRSFVEQYGPWAVVAGASVGLGAEFAAQLAARGLSLLLVARRAAPLESLAERLRAEHAVEVRTHALDLGAPDLLERLQALTDGLDVGLLVYNAAHAPLGPFLDGDLSDLLRALDVNCRGPLVLAHTLGGQMARRGRGGIVLMSSLAGSQGTALVATYAATKAFDLVLAEGLWEELRAHGVDVIACRAGATRTPGMEASRPRRTQTMMEPAPVVAATLTALGRRPSLVPGLANRAAAFFLGRVLGRRAAVRVMGRATRRLYER
jgi:short-subunit dehydrogenase